MVLQVQQRLQELETELMQLHARQFLNEASGEPLLRKRAQCRCLPLQS